MVDRSEDEQWDWVSGRHECKTFHVFKDLQTEIGEDVDVRNGQLSTRQKEDYISFKLIPNSETTFHVDRVGANRFASVRFDCNDTTISVQTGKGQPLFDAKLTLNGAGQCRLKVNDSEVTHWQFRMKALEDLFFNL